jgi:hypothetical protein
MMMKRRLTTERKELKKMKVMGQMVGMAQVGHKERELVVLSMILLSLNKHLKLNSGSQALVTKAS